MERLLNAGIYLRGIKIGKHVIQLWLVAVVLISVIAGAVGYYVWKNLTVQVEVKEPIEILHYPSSLSLYPGETKEFNVTVDNHASVNYSVVLDFHLENATYQEVYTTFSNKIYAVLTGQQNLTAWIQVGGNAPSINTSLTVSFARDTYPSGLVGYWRLDEGKGDIAFDISDNANHGLLMYGPTWENGKYGKALLFDGINDYVIISDSASLRVQSFTLSAWVYMTVRPYQAGHPGHPHVCIINKLHYMGPSGTTGYKLDFEDPTATDDTLVISIGDGTAQRFLVQYNSINDLTLNQWHQIVGTYDGSTATLYIDGQLKASGQGSYTILHEDTPLCFSREISQPVYDGFNGIMDNIMVHNRALSPQEVLAEYIGTTP
jgi:hypothetical protein